MGTQWAADVGDRHTNGRRLPEATTTQETLRLAKISEVSSDSRRLTEGLEGWQRSRRSALTAEGQLKDPKVTLNPKVGEGSVGSGGSLGVASGLRFGIDCQIVHYNL